MRFEYARRSMQAILPLYERRPWRERWSPNGEVFLLLALAAEVLVFAAVAPNFFSVENFFEVIRLSVEVGLLSIALTPVIITGGIDLSVGSIMGLCAVVFGATRATWGLSDGAAVLVSLLAGTAGGALNAFFITRLNLPP